MMLKLGRAIKFFQEFTFDRNLLYIVLENATDVFKL